jgi:hypothetical protein
MFYAEMVSFQLKSRLFRTEKVAFELKSYLYSVQRPYFAFEFGLCGTLPSKVHRNNKVRQSRQASFYSSLN